jgi:hypothetical protein
MANRLAGSASPYLLQHADNPVDWYPWGPEALDRARELDRPIFLSIGYSACHWCHVMAHESFEDPAIADRLNRGFVPIKVDREERPDIDDVYLGAVQAMTGSGGWPLSVFLTPDLEPFFGGTYFPPDDRHGLPAFSRVLDSLAEAWTGQRADIVRSAAEIADHLRHAADPSTGRAEFGLDTLVAAANRTLAALDPAHGGFGRAPKFPPSMTLEFLLRRSQQDPSPRLLEAVTLTLDRMAEGGIHDQVGGGFARYSTDEQWLAPHFEKMLYDNALLAHAYLEGYRATGDAGYAAVARRVFAFMDRELQTDDGGYAAALDADSEGEEGRFYVWDDPEFRRVLAEGGLRPEQVGALARAWDVRPEGNWEGHTILRRIPDQELDKDLEGRARTVLLEARGHRVRPGTDTKVLAAWNGLALRAIAHGALVLADTDLAARSGRLAAFIRTRLVHDTDRLWRVAPVPGSLPTPGFAEDYAFIADGLLAAYAAGGDETDLDLALALADRMLADFWDEPSGTLNDTGPDHELLIVRPRTLVDSATPSATAVAADVILRLAVIRGDADLDRRARRILAGTAANWASQPTAFGRTLSAAERALAEPIDVVVAGPSSDPGSVALRRAAASVYAPNLVIAPLDGPRAEAIFVDKVARNGVATAYVCRGYACLEPTADPEVVAAQVRSLSGSGGEEGSAGLAG